MAPDLHTGDGTTVGGWVLRGTRSTFDTDAMIERFGQVYRYPVAPGERADLMGPGQPCFLHLGDTSRVVGIWAIGEVVAPVLWLGEDGAETERGRGTPHAEVELYPIRKAIADTKLRQEPALAESELFTRPDQANPVILSPAAVRAVEGFDFDLVPPDEEQVALLDQLLADEEAAQGYR